MNVVPLQHGGLQDLRVSYVHPAISHLRFWILHGFWVHVK